MYELALFAGAGGGILAGKQLGWRTVCAVERDAYAASVLAQRQNDGLLEPFPIWSDVSTFDGKPWKGIVDVVSGGFPCQDISTAGRGAGIKGKRSGLWSEFARIIGEVLPRYAFIENSPALTVRGLDRVLCDLAQMGFDARWCVIGADAVGLPHKRARIWVVADAEGFNGNTWDLLGARSFQSQGEPGGLPCTKISPDWRRAYQGAQCVSIFRDPADGLAAEVDELRALGNGQVPASAALAFRVLTQGIMELEV